VGGTIHIHLGETGDSMRSGSVPVAAEAIFGSAARGDGDRFSDIDYLIVDDDPQSLGLRKAWLSSRGFSVSDYSWKRLGSAFRNQTMFALHLAMEAKVITDKNSQLACLFSRYEPKSRYLADLDRSFELLRPLEHMPHSSSGYGWAFDLLAVAFRNSAILALADEGKYVFSMKSIVSELRRIGRVSTQHEAALLRLRKLKSRYRSGIRTSICKATLDDSLRAVSSALDVDFAASIQRPGAIIVGRTNSLLAYATMRSVEAELLAVPPRVLKNAVADSTHRGLLRAVRNPHSYLWQFMHRQAAINDGLGRLRSFY
jgi:hypothetical protein